MRNTVRVARYASTFVLRKSSELPMSSAIRVIIQLNSVIQKGNAQDAVCVP